MPAVFTKEIKNKNEEYTDFDGAGIIYPYVANKKWNNVYRVEARLKMDVDFNNLEDAVKIMKKKYPYFFSRVSVYGKKYVLKCGYSSNIIFKNAPLCKPFDIKEEETLLRVVYTQRTIGVEFFHGITDGHGAQMFFEELLKEYLNIMYSRCNYDSPRFNKLPTNENLLRLNDIYTDIYNLGGKSVSRFLSKAYQFSGKNSGDLSSVSINAYSSSIKSAAHKYGVSVSEYLCAVQIAAILKTEKVKNKTLRISVPVDLRRHFDIASTRNASLYILVKIKPNEIRDFKTLLQTVKMQFEQSLTKENMQNLAYSNVKCAKMKAYNILPIPIKKVVLNIGYTTFGENQFTSTLTNLGIVNLNPNVKNAVSSIYYILGKEKTKPLNLTVTTYNNELRIIVSSTFDSKPFVDSMCEILLADGVITELENLNCTADFNKPNKSVSKAL